MGRNVGGATSTGQGAMDPIIFGEVVDVVMTAEHPQFTNVQIEGDYIGYIGIKRLGGKSKGNYPTEWIAPLNMNIQKLPLKGEHVICVKGSDANAQSTVGAGSYYWISVTNLDGDINNCLQPNSAIYEDEEANDEVGDSFAEKAVKKMQPIEGDTIIQSRWESGLRFTSTAASSKPGNYWSVGSDDGDPLTILVNGYVDDGEDANMTDILEDASTILMTSTQKIDFELANSESPESVAMPSGPAPPLEAPNAFSGSPQIIINSDRLIFNARNDSVLISAKKEISLSTASWKINISAIADLLLELLTQLAMETHPTPAGPSGPPIQAPIYTQLKGQLETMKQ